MGSGGKLGEPILVTGKLTGTLHLSSDASKQKGTTIFLWS